jgi:hypothetical protein
MVKRHVVDLPQIPGIYADLGRYYRTLIDAWIEERGRKKSDEG